MDLLKSKPKRSRNNNLTKAERKGLQELKLNNDIIIRKADKGSAVVIMNTKDYLREDYRRLQDTNFYKNWIMTQPQTYLTVSPKYC